MCTYYTQCGTERIMVAIYFYFKEFGERKNNQELHGLLEKHHNKMAKIIEKTCVILSSWKALETLPFRHYLCCRQRTEAAFCLLIETWLILCNDVLWSWFLIVELMIANLVILPITGRKSSRKAVASKRYESQSH